MTPKENSGVRLWQKAKTLIPGGGQLLSKRAERFLPGLWPAYFSKAKGCEVWDLDGNHYYDFAQMGVGSCILGYADPDVNAAVNRCVEHGNMCSLNCAEEVALAERLLALHPWAGMARFSRSGGEACAVAVRIARAASGRSTVAFCGYHGWHDWYLAANLGDTHNLDGQLLPGLSPCGLPRGLRGTALPFQYNNLASLERLAADHGEELGVIILEPERGQPPAPGFLEGVRTVANRLKAVLIFDEVTSGFRMNVGGIHRISGVDPDIAVLGKGMSNGFPMAAVIGRVDVMDAAQDSFISSTFWTERIGFVSALAAIEKMERCEVPSHLIEHGLHLIEGLRASGARNSLALSISGIPPLIYLNFAVGEPMEVQTFYAQEMLKKGYLVGGAIYTTYAYSRPILDRFLTDTDSVFSRVRRHLDEGGLAKHLEGDIIQTGFRRLA